MNILLVALHSSPAHHSLGLASLQAYLARETPAATVTVREHAVAESPDDIADDILAGQPDLVGFSCAIWNIDAVRRLCALLRALNPGMPIVLGGPEVVDEVEELMTGVNAADAVVHGEGEIVFADLLRSFVQGRSRPFSGPPLPGVTRRQDPPGQATASSPADLEHLPSPFLEGFIPAGRPFLYWETTRGCRSRCAFCLSSREPGVRRFPMARVEAELDWFARHEVPLVRVIDRTFNDDSAWACAVLDRVLRATPPGTRFHFEIDGYRLDEDFLSLCRTAPRGKLQFEVGVQSLDPAALRAVRRSVNTGRLLANLETLSAATRVSLHCDLLLGLPHQGFDDLRQGLRRLIAIRPEMIQIETLKLLRGTDLRQEVRRERWPHEPYAPYRVLATPWIARPELRRAETLARAIDRIRNPWYLRSFADAAALRSGDPARFWEVFCDWWRNDATFRQKDLPARARFALLGRFLDCAVQENGWDPLLHEDLRYAWLCLERPASRVLPGVDARSPISPDQVQAEIDAGRIVLDPVEVPGAETTAARLPRAPTADRNRCRVQAFTCDPARRLADPAGTFEAMASLFVFVYPRPDDPFHRPLVFRARRTRST